jgi:hypothetical protein
MSTESRTPGPLSLWNLVYPHRRSMVVGMVESSVVAIAAIVAVIVWTKTALFVFLGVMVATYVIGLVVGLALDRRVEEPFTAPDESVFRFVRWQRAFEYGVLGVVLVAIVIRS